MSDTIDTVHRLGPKRQDVNKPRNIIIQFSSRVSRDAIWRAAKSSPYLMNNSLKFAEDLSREDRECRSKLWPDIKAREDGCPKKTLKPLQLIQNAAARVLTGTRIRDHISPVLASLHWLPVAARIDFKVFLELLWTCCCGPD